MSRTVLSREVTSYRYAIFRITPLGGIMGGKRREAAWRRGFDLGGVAALY